ncbi:MAG: hydroxymyristoyl-ACP dehydratase [Bacteroidales bacterium]|jgi:predicted hotdog family 3-hydroxylacyl-ACP dehydratase|nr:hydroxymyristoyl-ACP dehydratase [Bacteroidales bacterium]
MNSDITELIPQRAPFIFVDTIFDVEENALKSNWLIPADSSLVQNNELQESGLMEHVAQSMAAYIGYCSNGEIKIGVIGAIKHFVIYQKPQAGDTLYTSITILGRVFTTILFRAEIRLGNILLAEGEMKVTVP